VVQAEEVSQEQVRARLDKFNVAGLAAAIGDIEIEKRLVKDASSVWLSQRTKRQGKIEQIVSNKAIFVGK